MIDIFLNFRVNLLFNSVNVIPDTPTIAKVLELFKDEEFIPSTIYEIGPEGQKPRVRMSSTDNKWNIVFLQRNVTIEYVCGPADSRIGVIDDFLTKAEKIAEKIFRYLGQKSNRLALIVHALSKEMTKAELESCYNKLFNALPFYRSISPFEWNNRSASREEISFADVSERVNVITEIKRIQGQMVFDSDVKEFDRIQLQYELNTIPENAETRFSAEQLGPFMKIAKGNYEKIVKDLESAING